MKTSREDFGIVIRSAFLKKETKQRFSLFALVVFSIILIYVETIKTKPLDYLRFFVKDTIYRGSVIVSFPSRGFNRASSAVKNHLNLFNTNIKLKEENTKLKEKIYDPDFLIFENKQLRQLLDEQVTSSSNFVSARVILDKQSPYPNSFVINSGSNREIKNSMTVLDGKNFIGRIVDVNFFSSRVLLITDLNSKIPVLVEPTGYHAILNGRGMNEPTLEYLPEKHTVQSGNKVYTSGKEGIFAPGIPIGEVRTRGEKIFVSLFSDISQITFVNINLGEKNN
jgi:rod shape-determining protein MreC|tara:strand:- start:2456 stop:3298 length:843 start_codon:yes stop_codon:yes gene_type:complete